MISVILVTYNSLAVLPNCMTALENSHAAQDLEIVVADNGSADGTLEWLKAYQQSHELPFDKVIVLPLNANRGYAYANNRAIERARGDILLLLNPDTVVSAEAIGVCARVLHQQSTLGAVGCRLELPDGRLDKSCKRSFPTLWNSFTRFSGLSLLFPQSRWLASYNLTYLDAQASYPVDSLSGAFMMVPAAVKDELGGLDEDYFMYGEDIDWCFRMKQAGYRIWYEGTVSTIHLKGGNGGKRSRESLTYFYSTMHLYFVKTRPSSRVTVIIKWFLRSMLFVHLAFRWAMKRIR